MKKFSELTLEQALEIGKLALKDFTNFDTVLAAFKGEPAPIIEFEVTRSYWSESKERNLEKIQVIAIGLGNTCCNIWENDTPEDTIDISVVDSMNEIGDVANQAAIYRKLMEWEFIAGPNEKV